MTNTAMCPEWPSDYISYNNTFYSPSVDLSDLSRSYPFLDLSRRLGAEYGAMLRASDQIDANIAHKGYSQCSNIAHRCKLSYETVTLIRAVCAAPWRWEFPPRGRGP